MFCTNESVKSPFLKLEVRVALGSSLLVRLLVPVLLLDGGGGLMLLGSGTFDFALLEYH